jgi:hypothetical protein
MANITLFSQIISKLDRSKIYFDLLTQYQKNKWHLDLTTPINMQTYAINDKPLQRKKNFNTATFEPRLSIV